MKICLLCEYYPPIIPGGAEICAKILAEGLAEAGTQVVVLTPNFQSSRTETKNKDNLKIIRYRSPKRHIYRGKTASSGIHNKTRSIHRLLINQYAKYSAKELAKQFEKLDKQEQFDIVHGNNIESTLALTYIKNTKAKKIGHIRDLSFYCPGYRTRNGEYCDDCNPKNIAECQKTNRYIGRMIHKDIVVKRLKRLSRLQQLIAINEYIRQETEKTGIPCKVYSIYDPITDNQISSLTKKEARKKLGITRQTILFVGSLSPQKNAGLVIDLAKIMKETEFLVFGEGPMKPRFTEAHLPNLKYMGFSDPEMLAVYYRAADLFINPAQKEWGISRVVFEAMANGLPVAGFPIRGIDEIIQDNKTGFTFKSRTPEEISKEAMKILKNKTKLARVSRTAQQNMVNKFRIRPVIKKTLQTYRKIIAGQG